MRKSFDARGKWYFCGFVGCALILLICGFVGAQDLKSNEGGDLTIGGPGSGPGEFLQLRHITFDAAGNLYALDGVHLDAKTKQPEGNLRVQKFSRDGKLLGTIDLHAVTEDEKGLPMGDTVGPQRIAATADGEVYVTFPDSGKICRFNSQGKLVHTYRLPHAMAICVWNGPEGKTPQRIAVVASRREVAAHKGWTWMDGNRIVLLDPAADEKDALSKNIDLEQSFQNVQDITSDRTGNFYIKADPNGIFEFSPEGKRLRTFGGNPTTRAEDGSELLHCVAVDSKGNVYGMTWGNPGMVTRFDADGKTVTQRGGQFKWADPWSTASSYVTIAIDPDDRLWVGACHTHRATDVNFNRYRATPVIVRTKPDFFENPASAVRTVPVRTLGYKPVLACDQPYNISYEPGKPVSMRFDVKAGNREVNSVAVKWQVFDALKNPVAAGQFDLPLENGKEAGSSFSFTPGRYGSYFVMAESTSPQGSMGAVGEHVGVAPEYPGMQTLEAGQGTGGWVDPARQVWTGLPNLRIHPGKNEKQLLTTDEQIAAAKKAGLTFLVQLVSGMKDLTPEYVRLIASRYKGQVHYYEICNEPNFSSNADEYFAGHKMAYAIIKEIDPQAQVMGPATVNINLQWFARLYDLGFKDVSDIISTHDYEGHESITPEHWQWKIAQLRQIMAAHGDAAKPIWQTERAISGVRGYDYQGLVQAIRCTLHHDLLESLGIPPEHNFHYYMNQGGYSSVPSYLWSSNGPHPAALALRTRHGLTSALNRSFQGALDFGRTGNTLLMGLRYVGKDGQTIVLRNLGSRAMPTDFQVKGEGVFEWVDAWGNRQNAQSENGRLTLNVEQLPIYLLLKPGQDAQPAKLDFGDGVSSKAKWEYTSAVEKGDFSLLSNGILETYHDADPNGGTNGAQIFTGDLPAGANGEVVPQTLTATFPQPQTIGKIVIRGVRADNTFCALLDYDLEYLDGNQWKLIESVRRPMPPSEEVQTADAHYAIWMDDTNFFVHAFHPVTASAIRIRVLRVTHGFVPDERASAWGKSIAPKLMLREVEICPAGGN